MKLKQLLFTFLGLGLFLSCQETLENEKPEVEQPVVTKSVFSGYVQKGPFANGSSVTILELDENLNQTGRIYFATISDNSGSFEQKNFELISNYVTLKADGYYFNEVSGHTSTSQITLYALVDIGDVNSSNVNVLTHLARARVEYLVQQESYRFAEAKQQAQKEVMAIFGVPASEVKAFESLNLTNDAVLLAISSILQGTLSTGDMAVLMADIITDIRTDGVLDNITLKTKLINNAEAILPSSVRNNLISKYAELGINITIPDFEHYVNTFINSAIDPEAVIIYPENGAYGPNILSDAVTTVKAGSDFYSMNAIIPLGMSLKINIKDDNRLGSSGSFVVWSFDENLTNWYIGERDQVTYNQKFGIVKSGNLSDLKLQFYIGKIFQEVYRDYITIEYYENASGVPTKIKKLYIEQ